MATQWRQPKRVSFASGILIATTLLLLSALLLLRGGYHWNTEGEIDLDQHASLVPATQVEIPSSIRISSQKVAAIVENRPLENLIPIILHFSSVLGVEWAIHIFTIQENQGLFFDSGPFQREVAAGRFHVRSLPDDEKLSSHASVSDFFTKPWFWEQLAPAEHILMFQADSILCSKAPQKVEDFLQYDFVGAPVRDGLGLGYNGGLSIRNRTMCLDIVNNFDW
jgi:hypothetical protein